jgi:hypothetical protein
MFRFIAIALTLCLATVTARASLVSRAAGQAYYDDVLDITWVADANLAQTSGYDADGLMTWSEAQGWIASLNTVGYLGVSDWRLPTVTDTGTSGCNFAFSGTDCGYNMDLATGEMAHLFYSTLGNSASYNTSGAQQLCLFAGPNYCLTNTGPFSNLQPGPYWPGAEYEPLTGYAWVFHFEAGFQGGREKSDASSAWAVSPGDTLSAVPIPPAIWLFGSSLGLLGFARRNTLAKTCPLPIS